MEVFAASSCKMEEREGREGVGRERGAVIERKVVALITMITIHALINCLNDSNPCKCCLVLA